MLRDLLPSIFDWLPIGDPEKQVAKDAWKRANEAYAATWKTQGDLDRLRTEIQARNVPGSFVEGDPSLQLHFDAWRLGHDPQTVKPESRRALSAK